MDDVLETVALDTVAASPDSDWLAAVVQRPARAGEIYGRTAYEVDPSRADIWLISRQSGELRALTDGKGQAAGFWCPIWSPSGRRLAMLSTMPENGEPRGGDNVRLYVWEGATAPPRRIGDAAMMTQTRYGGPLHALDVRSAASGHSTVSNCRANEENAPFLWLDDQRLLAVTLPPGERSALIDQHDRFFRHVAETRSRLRNGTETTLTTIDSSPADIPAGAGQEAVLRIIDVASGRDHILARLPAYPFFGALTISVAPDGRSAAILASAGAIPIGHRSRYNNGEWLAEKRLGFLDLADRKDVRWTTMPSTARYPLELLEWSPDGRRVALRAREDERDTTRLFVATADTGNVEAASATLTMDSVSAGPYPHEASALWIDDRRLLVRGRIPGENAKRWRLVEPGARAPAVRISGLSPPNDIRRVADGRLVGIAGTQLVALDPKAQQFANIPVAPLPENARIAWPPDPYRRSDMLLIETVSATGQRLITLDLSDGSRSNLGDLPVTGELLDADPSGLLWREPTRGGLFLRQIRPGERSSRTLLSLNRHLGDIRWGETRLIDYAGADGKPLNAAVILPPAYRPGKHYPVLTWIYPGHVVDGLDDYFLDPFMPGLYNLQLYAARGYVVLIPSMPLDHSLLGKGIYDTLPVGVLPAVDRLAALGIADPARVGLMGQSLGGYGVYGLLAQTDRIKAGIALAGITDLAAFYRQFGRLARGYPGIEHERSANPMIARNVLRLADSPESNPDLYNRNSPLTHAGRINTPLLLIHGEFDERGGPDQAEAMFSSLLQQNKKARLLRYWGETHSLAQSPANIRDIVDQIGMWLDEHLTNEADRSPSSSRK